MESELKWKGRNGEPVYGYSSTTGRIVCRIETDEDDIAQLYRYRGNTNAENGQLGELQEFLSARFTSVANAKAAAEKDYAANHPGEA